VADLVLESGRGQLHLEREVVNLVLESGRGQLPLERKEDLELRFGK
jgi:hypothetical protein